MSVSRVAFPYSVSSSPSQTVSLPLVQSLHASLLICTPHFLLIHSPTPSPYPSQYMSFFLSAAHFWSVFSLQHSDFILSQRVFFLLVCRPSLHFKPLASSDLFSFWPSLLPLCLCLFQLLCLYVIFLYQSQHSCNGYFPRAFLRHCP